MPRVVAYDDVKSSQFWRRNTLHTPFIEFPREFPELPVAFLSQGVPNRVIRPHYHLVDEFIIVAEGGGTLGHTEVSPYSVFFARAFTPYGPLVGDSKTGISFFVLSARFEEGAQYLPETLDNLKQMKDRTPWQVKRKAEFPPRRAGAVNLQEIPGIKDDQGLFAYTINMAPDSRTAAPDPADGDGQFIVTVQGSLWHEGKEHKAYTVTFVEPKEGPFPLHAGPQGLEAIILNSPRTTARPPAKRGPSVNAAFRKWQCELCAFAYDEAIGLPEDGIPAGTRWADVPDTWSCPDCAARKSDFRMVEVS